MNPSPGTAPEDRRRRHEDARRQLASLLRGEPDPIARMASAAALLAALLPQASFAGFYRALDQELVIGPYQGPPACLRIPFGRGVCGTCARENRALLVPDVRAFAGHIACDPLARSELVLPVRDPDGGLVAICDLDSREPAAFDGLDREELEATLQLLFERA